MIPRISYIATTRNRRPWIESALEHWSGIKAPGDELVIADGASTDGTADIVSAHVPRVVDRFISEPDLGEAHGFNKCMLASTGRYLKLLTDDDRFHREGLEAAYRAMDGHPEIDVLVTGGAYVDRARDPGSDRPYGYQWYPDRETLLDRTQYVGLTGIGIVVRRASLSRLGLMDTRHIHVDTSYLTQAVVRGAVVRYLRVNAFTHYFYPHSNSRWSPRKLYIYRDHNFTRMSRWRYLRRPGLAVRILLERAGLRPRPLAISNPVWDGALL